ncbi:unnamed protein product [Tuber aestivum]|uniref:Dolichol phosphate-mannose biosynthesis regulatory protein n=1 Tax=Tuber aestivum TaxID=59557 RepID=A0A292PPQ9_9PEZI|nr:unnamed protein product [Tuber aestivum]
MTAKPGFSHSELQPPDWQKSLFQPPAHHQSPETILHSFLSQRRFKDIKPLHCFSSALLRTMLAKLTGVMMLMVASIVFLYYSIWTLFMPFVDDGHPLHDLFPPRVWAIRIPVILILVGIAVVGSFLSVVMIRSGRKKAAKAKAAAGQGKKKN